MVVVCVELYGIDAFLSHLSCMHSPRFFFLLNMLNTQAHAADPTRTR